MQKNLAVTSSPHLRDNISTRRIMQEVCLALAPAGIAGIILYGSQAAMLIAAAVVTAVVAEWAWEKLNHQPSTVGDWSAVVTGLLLAYNLPANAPVWLAVVGSLIAIILVKQMFGGIGSNFMNPALTARAILFVSWSQLMAAYPQTNFAVDAMSTATPLATLASVGPQGVSLWNLLIGNCGGVLGETCKLAIILGGVYLIARGIIDWKIPVSFIVTVFLCYLVKDGATMALYQMMAGGLMLGAFFMATDYVTSPVSNSGRIIMGVGCGLLLFVIRAFASYPEGCSFAILFMNVATPLIDKFTVSKPFGEVKKHG
ncbi:MAG: RnfABCDGE type electron transport complex subunit D [Aristaeellaceae bacterium]